MIHVFLLRLAIDGKQLVHTGDDADRIGIHGIELDGIDKLTPRMRQAAGVDHMRPAYFGVALVAVCLQQTIEIAQPLLWPLAIAAHAEVEDHAFTGRAVLPQVCLMIAPTPVVGLYTDRR